MTVRLVENEPGSPQLRLRLFQSPSWPTGPAPDLARCVEWAGSIGRPTSYALLGYADGTTNDFDGDNGREFFDSLTGGRDEVRFGFEPEQHTAAVEWMSVWGFEGPEPFGAHGLLGSSEVAFATAATFLCRTDPATWAADDSTIRQAWGEARAIVASTYTLVRTFRTALSDLGRPLATNHRLISGRIGALPAALRTLYHFTGNHPLNHVHNRLIDPDRLRPSNGKLIFLEENQQSVVWAVDVKSLAEDPLVWQGQPQADKESSFTWYSEEKRLSEFITEMWAWVAELQE